MSPAPAAVEIALPQAPPTAVVGSAAASHPAGPSAPPPAPAHPAQPASSAVRRRSRSVSTSSSLGSHLASDDDDDEGDELSDDDDDDSSAAEGVEAAAGLARLDRLPPPSSAVPQGGGSFVKKAKPDSPPGMQQQQQQHPTMQHQQQQQGGNQPARKQNVACDPCRSRKVKCLRTNGSDKCDSCLQKTLVCTNHYVTSLQNKERRKATGERPARIKNGGTGAGGLDIPGAGLAKRRKVSDERLPMATDGSGSSYGGRHDYGGSYGSAAGPSSSSVASSSILPPPVVGSHGQIPHQPAYQTFLPPTLHYPGVNGSGAPGYGSSLPGAVGGGGGPSHHHPLPFPLGVDQMPLPLPHPGAGPSAGPRYLQQQQQQQQAGPASYLPPPQQHPAYGQPSGSSQQHQQQPALYRQTTGPISPQPSASSLPPPVVTSSAVVGTGPALVPFPPPMASLLAYLFSPTEVTSAELGYTDQTLVGHAGGKRELFDSPPSQAHRSLLGEALRMELANDLIESYFQIVHIRMPLVAQSIFKAEFAAATVSHVKLAVILALGAKFSEHPTIAMDREQTSAAVASSPGATRENTSRLVRLLVARAQQVLEVNRAYRTPTLENIQAALLMEGLLNPFTTSNGSLPAKPAESTPGRNVTSHSKGFWTTVAIRHLLELRCNHMRTILAVEDELRRGALLFAWWLACLSDSMGALFWRQKPVLCDDDYDNEPPAAWDGEHYQPVDNPEEYKKWYMSAHDLAKIAREACSRLWTPRVESAGIPLAALQQLVNLLCGWRDVHLSTVAVPNQWPSSWDFVHAVTACAADSNFHVMWLTLHRALVDFDILEAKEIAAGRMAPASELVARLDSVRSQLSQEAAHAATRISALAVVLTTNGYLRLDPNVLHYPILEAGTFLARYGMTEVEGCIAGLRQYGTSYEECYAQADALEQSYARSKGQAGPSVAISAPPLYAGGAGQLQPELTASRRTSYSPSGDVVPAAARLALDSTPASEASASSASAPSTHDAKPHAPAPTYPHPTTTSTAAIVPPTTPSLPEQAAATLTRWSLSPSVDPHTKVYGGFASTQSATAFAQGS